MQGSVLRVVLNVASAPPCKSVDAASEKEEGDVGCSVFSGSSHLLGIHRGICMSQDEIRAFVLFGLRACGL